MPSPPRRQDNPILRDVRFGRGGIAGGKFTNGPSDTLDSRAGLYVLTGYIDGPDGYVFKVS